MTNLRENIWAVEVPEDATDPGFINDCLVCKVPGMKAGRYKWLHEADEAMSKLGGEWEVICTTTNATFTQAALIVEQQDDGFKDYNKDNFHHDLPFMSPFDSLRSLLAAKGLTGNNYLIIKKV